MVASNVLVLIALLMSKFVKGMIPHVAKSQSPPGPTLVVQWFRGADLRLHDNPALCKAVQLAKTKDQAGILFLYCFDPRVFGDARSKYGSLKCGPKRAKFIVEAVTDLRKSLEEKGSGLIVAHGKPEDVLSRLLAKTKTEGAPLMVPHVICQEEVCSEELAVEKAVRNAITSIHPRATLTKVWGSTLYNKDDLPFADGPFGIPDTFTPFRTKVESKCSIGKPLPVPSKGDLKISDQMKASSSMEKCSLLYMPTLQDLGYTKEEVEFANQLDERGVLDFRGGERVALARVKDYIWDKDLLKVYFDTRNGMIGGDYSTKFAPWLAMGCLSPRFVAAECKRYEQERVANKSTYWVVFELLWRDYFKFFALKHSTKLFFQGGTIGSDQKWNNEPRYVQAWKEGKTGFPLVDANMRELAATGFMSNRGRQNVASFFALDMKSDWRYGADYFEETLLDYDVHSNWGNWCAAAGMTGGRVNRFNIVKQSKDYDQHGDYVRHWLPELKDVPNTFVHEPWKMSRSDQKEFNCQLGVDYPNRIVGASFEPRPYGKSMGDRNAGGGRTKRDGPNTNRGRGQRQDMKSLKTGQIRMS
jgi:deoxyribodipyrimidine photo-lyase